MLREELAGRKEATKICGKNVNIIIRNPDESIVRQLSLILEQLHKEREKIYQAPQPEFHTLPPATAPIKPPLGVMEWEDKPKPPPVLQK